jgi:hypothetical protein
VVLVCVFIALYRRLIVKPFYIDSTYDAYLILSLVGSLMIAFYGMNGAEHALGKLRSADYMFISKGLAKIYSGMPEATIHIWARAFWWAHALILLFFLNYLPYSKHLHILTALPNCFFRSFKPVTTVPRLTFKKGLSFGISKITQFRWKDLMDFTACTECGRCQANCPAFNTQKPLNPKEVIHQGKLNLFANGKDIMAHRPADMLAPAPVDATMSIPLINGREESISRDAIWACTTCGA